MSINNIMLCKTYNSDALHIRFNWALIPFKLGLNIRRVFQDRVPSCLIMKQ